MLKPSSHSQAEKKNKEITPAVPKPLLSHFFLVIWCGFIELFYFIYRLILSPIFAFLGARCRYEETCSSYARRVLREKGPFEGIYLVLLRLWSCR